MAHSLSAQKRIRQNTKSRAHNRWQKRGFRELIKDFNELILHGTVEQSQEKLSAVYKSLDQVAAHNTIHKNTAARYKSRLTAKLNLKKSAPAAA